MKLLCVADHVDPLVYSNGCKSRFQDVELVISAGDLPMEYLGFIASTLNKPVLFVFGNHNLSALKRFRRPGGSITGDIGANFTNYYGATSVDGRIRKVKGLLVAGLGGSIQYNGGEHQFTEFQMITRILKLVPRLLWNRLIHGRFLDILVTHAAPRGINDAEDKPHVGFKAFLWFMRRFRPQYLLHGHIHLYDLNADRYGSYEDTTVINVYDHYVLEMSEDGSGERSGSVH